MAAPILVAGSAAWILKRVLLWFFLAKGAAIVARILGVLGLALFTSELIIQPVLTAIQSNASNIPPELHQWLAAFGFYRCVSIIATAYMLLMAKRVFLGRSGGEV